MGVPNSVSHAEATLNWQSENVVAQNKVLTQILAQQTKLVKTQETFSSQVKSLETSLDSTLSTLSSGLHFPF
jgi:hypothetical protein